MSVFFRRKKRSPQEVNNEHNSSEDDSRLMRKHKAKSLHLMFSDIMRKLKHAIKKETPRQDERLLGKKKSFQKSLSTKDHYFLERMTSISQKRSHQDHYEDEKRLSEMVNNGDFGPNMAMSKQFQRSVSLPEFFSRFSSPGRRWDQNSTVHSRSASYNFIKSETFADDSITIKETETASPSQGSSPFISKSNQAKVVDEMSNAEAYDVEEREGDILKETFHEESLPPLSLLSVASPSDSVSKTEEHKLVLEPLFIVYEISPARGAAQEQPLCGQFQERNHPMDDKESVFKYVKAVLDAVDLNWEELYLKTEFCDQLLYPALISKIPFYPNQLCADHELLFDCINEVLFEFCRFPQWVSFVKPRIQVLSYSVGSIVREVQEKVYCHLLPMQIPQSLYQRVREDMAKPRSWLDIRCDLECIGFETCELILNELLEELMLDL